MVGPAQTENGDARGRLLAAATRLFAAQGVEATSVQAVADEVGLSKQAVLHHFPSKDALRRAVLDEILRHWADTLPGLLLRATADEDRFDAVFHELRRFFGASPERARVIVREALDRPDEVRRLLRGPVRPWLAAVANYLRAGQRRGSHRDDVDAEAYVIHVFQLVVTAAAGASVCAVAIDAPERERRARYDRELQRIAQAGLFPAPPRKRGSR